MESELRHLDHYLGNRLRKLRRSKNMTLVDIATKLGISPQQLQKYEHGITKISVDTMKELALILGVRPHYFFDGYGHGQASLLTVDVNIINTFSTVPLHVLVVETTEWFDKIKSFAVQYDCPIHFTHCKTPEEALDRFSRRLFTQGLPHIVISMMPEDEQFARRYILAMRQNFTKGIPMIILGDTLNRARISDLYTHHVSGYMFKHPDSERMRRSFELFFNYWCTVSLLPERS